MQTFKRIIAILLVVTMFNCGYENIISNNVYAADNTVKIFFGDSKTARHHKAIPEGTVTDNLSFEVKGATVKSSSYASTNTKSFTIENDNGNYYVKGQSEGTGYVVLTIKTTDNRTLTEKLFISIFKRIKNCKGIVNENTDIYRGATDNANVENEDDKGDMSKNTEVKVFGKCNDYYVIQTTDGTVFADNQDTGFIKKKYVDILVTGIKFSEENMYVNAGDKKQLEVEILPQEATNKNIKWTSSSTKIADVDENGIVYGKKIGTTTITATTEDGNYVATCQLEVLDNKYGTTKHPVKPMMVVEYVGFNTIHIEVTSKNKFKGIEFYVDGKRLDECEFASMDNVRNFKVTLDEVGTYDIYVKTYVYNGKSRVYEKMSNVERVTLGKVTIDTCTISKNTITVKWQKCENATKYEVYRATSKKGKYTLIKTLKGSSTSYTDKNVKKNKNYYYKVRPKNKVLTGRYSNIKKGKVYSIGKVAKYISKKYPNVFTKKTSINNANIFGYYPAVKYRFINNQLQIHVYLEFVTYTKTNKKGIDGKYIYKRGKASGKDSISTSKYISRFKSGLYKAYSKQNIKGSKYDFKKGINFTTKLVIHEKKKNSKYNKNQQFTEVLIGGECPNCTTAKDHWYHEGGNNNSAEYVVYKKENVIFMPTNAQVRKNADKGHRRPAYNYSVTSAHEMGHILGLDDAYETNGIDRCTDNGETGYEYVSMNYDNLMKNYYYKITVTSNDIEMMLEANELLGKDIRFASQSYKSYKRAEIEHKISRVIRNKKDYQKDGD